MRLPSALLAAFALLLVALPGSAWADPPANDNYFQSELLHDPGTAVPRDEQQRTVDTTDATTEGLIYPDVPEPTSCGATAYSKTVWYDFFPEVHGFVSVEAIGYDAIISSFPYRAFDDAEPFLDRFECIDDGEGVTTSGFFEVGPGNRSIQIGAADNTGGNLTFKFQFFADRDSDGRFDELDRCPDGAGTEQHSYCPDSDGDGLVDPDDRCPSIAGSGTLGGCPDSDGDGRADPDDVCPQEDAKARDKNGDGCLDILRLDKLVDSRLTFATTIPGFGVKVSKFTVTGVPAGSRVVVSCKRKGRRCGGKTVRSALAGPRAHASRTVSVKNLKGKRLRAGTKITVRVTATKAVGKFIGYTITARGLFFKRSNKCIPIGSKKPRRRC